MLDATLLKISLFLVAQDQNLFARVLSSPLSSINEQKIYWTVPLSGLHFSFHRFHVAPEKETDEKEKRRRREHRLGGYVRRLRPAALFHFLVMAKIIL